jgi:YD repeat-containing protein
MQPMRKKLLVLLVILSVHASSIALVDMRNANFSKTFSVWRFEKSQFTLETTYNSRTIYNGLFGFGWCSSLEGKLDWVSQKKDQIRYTSCGAGQETIWFLDPAESTGSERVFRSNQFQDLTRLLRETGDGFVFDYGQNHAGGVSRQMFDPEGRLRAIDQNNSRINLVYEGELLTEIREDGGEIWKVEYSILGKIRSISTPGNKVMLFEHDPMDNLTSVVNGWGKRYNYSYDQMHDLLRIDFPDKTSEALVYDTTHDWVIQFKDREECVETYDYMDTLGSSVYSSWVTKTCDSEVVGRSRYDFVNSGGKLIEVDSVVNGIQLQIKYDASSGAPTRIDAGAHSQFFEMDPSTAQDIRRRMAHFNEDPNLIEEEIVQAQKKAQPSTQ